MWVCTSQFFDKKAIEVLVDQENKLLLQRRDLRSTVKVSAARLSVNPVASSACLTRALLCLVSRCGRRRR
jgi:hypothetical protein